MSRMRGVVPPPTDPHPPVRRGRQRAPLCAKSNSHIPVPLDAAGSLYSPMGGAWEPWREPWRREDRANSSPLDQSASHSPPFWEAPQAVAPASPEEQSERARWTEEGLDDALSALADAVFSSKQRANHSRSQPLPGTTQEPMRTPSHGHGGTTFPQVDCPSASLSSPPLPVKVTAPERAGMGWADTEVVWDEAAASPMPPAHTSKLVWDEAVASPVHSAPGPSLDRPQVSGNRGHAGEEGGVKKATQPVVGARASARVLPTRRVDLIRSERTPPPANVVVERRESELEVALRTSLLEIGQSAGGGGLDGMLSRRAEVLQGARSP